MLNRKAAAAEIRGAVEKAGTVVQTALVLGLAAVFIAGAALLIALRGRRVAI